MPNEIDKCSFTWKPYFDCIIVKLKKKSNVHINLKSYLKPFRWKLYIFPIAIYKLTCTIWVTSGDIKMLSYEQQRCKNHQADPS